MCLAQRHNAVPLVKISNCNPDSCFFSMKHNVKGFQRATATVIAYIVLREYSKEPTQGDGSFEYTQHMLWRSGK